MQIDRVGGMERQREGERDLGVGREEERQRGIEREGYVKYSPSFMKNNDKKPLVFIHEYTVYLHGLLI